MRAMREWHLIVPALGVARVGRLVGDEHVIQVQPGERCDASSVVRQVCDETLLRGLADVKHQQGFGCLAVLSI